MGIGELFGVKQVKLSVSQPYTMEELYEKIKDMHFDAGVPNLVKNGLAYVIAFPAIDRNNQVQILGNKGKFVVSRAVVPAGVSNLAKNIALETVTDGLSGLSGAFGNKKKLCMELVQRVADSINQANI